MFYHEREIRKAVEDAREERETPDIRNGSGLPDPTVGEVIRRLTPVKSVFIGGNEIEINGQMTVVDAVEVKYPERWLTVIDKTYAWCKRQAGCHYEAARKRYLGQGYVAICMALNISQNVFFSLIEKIRMYAAIQAAQLNLICVD